MSEGARITSSVRTRPPNATYDERDCHISVNCNGEREVERRGRPYSIRTPRYPVSAGESRDYARGDNDATDEVVTIIYLYITRGWKGSSTRIQLYRTLSIYI